MSTAATIPSTANDAPAMTIPAPMPPTAPQTFMTTSERPCAPGRTASGTDSDSSADPATNPADQPSPSSTSPTLSRAVSDGPASAQQTPEASSINPPSPSTGIRPARSASQPNTGLNAYMPATCRLMT